jgi:hypothetical protein
MASEAAFHQPRSSKSASWGPPVPPNFTPVAGQPGPPARALVGKSTADLQPRLFHPPTRRSCLSAGPKSGELEVEHAVPATRDRVIIRTATAAVQMRQKRLGYGSKWMTSNPDCFDLQHGTIAVESGSKAVGWRSNWARLEGEFRREGTASVGVASLLV